MSGVLRVPCLQRLLGADVNGDGNDRQDADVPEGQMVVKQIWGITSRGFGYKTGGMAVLDSTRSWKSRVLVSKQLDLF